MTELTGEVVVVGADPLVGCTATDASVDLPAGVDTGVIRIAAAAYADAVLARTRDALPQRVDAGVVVARGDNIKHAVARLDGGLGKLDVVGSRRLAQPQRLFATGLRRRCRTRCRFRWSSCPARAAGRVPATRSGRRSSVRHSSGARHSVGTPRRAFDVDALERQTAEQQTRQSTPNGECNE